LAPFKAVPWARKRLVALAFVPIAAFIAVIALASVPISLNPQWNHNWVGVLIFLGLFLVAALIAFWLSCHLTLGEMARQCREDATNLGTPQPDERYVGVSYAATLALVQTSASDVDSAMDRGWIRLQGVDLCFRGYGMCFDLPASLVEAIEVAPTRSWIVAWLPRVVIRWRHPAGTVEHLWLEARVARNRRDLKAEIERLGAWLQEGLERGLAESGTRSAESELPLRSTLTERAVTFQPRRAKLADHVAAVAKTAVFAACAFPIDACLHAAHHPHLGNNVASGVGGISPALYVGVLIARQRRRRLREREAERAGCLVAPHPADDCEDRDRN
jgi:hypothetical protein